MAQALHMGDELHNRNSAASALLFKQLALSLLKSKLDSGAIQRTLTFIAGDDHYFLNISMAACKSMTDAAHGVPVPINHLERYGPGNDVAADCTETVVDNLKVMRNSHQSL